MFEFGSMVPGLILCLDLRATLLLIRIIHILNDCLALILSPLCFYSSGINYILLLILLLINLIVNELDCLHIFIAVFLVLLNCHV